MKQSFLFIIFFLGCFIKSAAQVYTVPDAQIQPAWVFPLWFETATGEHDTIYFCYDPLAKEGLPFDTLYGEKFNVMDTSKFNVYLECSFNYSTLLTRKTNVMDSVQNMGFGFCGWNTVFPVKIKWDNNLFYSTSLPYNLQLPAPTIQGVFSYDYFIMTLIEPGPQCYSPVLMTDTIKNATCYAMDSIVLAADPSYDVGGYFSIVPWNGVQPFGGAINEAITNSDISVMPNPADNFVVVTLRTSELPVIKLFNAQGLQINLHYQISYPDTNQMQIKVERESVLSGFYFLSITSGIYRSVKQIVFD